MQALGYASAVLQQELRSTGASLRRVCCQHLSELLEESDGQLVGELQGFAQPFRETLQLGFVDLLTARLPAEQKRSVLKALIDEIALCLVKVVATSSAAKEESPQALLGLRNIACLCLSLSRHESSCLHTISLAVLPELAMQHHVLYCKKYSDI